MNILEHKLEILRKSYEEILKAPKITAQKKHSSWFLFGIGENHFLCNPADLVEIRTAEKFVKIPSKHPHALGAITFRQQVCTILNLGSCLNLNTTRGNDKRGWIIIIRPLSLQCGFFVEELLGLHHDVKISHEDINYESKGKREQTIAHSHGKIGSICAPVLNINILINQIIKKGEDHA